MKSEFKEAFIYGLSMGNLSNIKYGNSVYNFIDKTIKGKVIVTDKNGDMHCYLNYFHHCTDGPAIKYTNGYMLWYIDGRSISKFDFDCYRISNMQIG